ncbi:MAG: aryl-sulfate sulfotransferase [Ilumatobacteraceae bacterium]
MWSIRQFVAFGSATVAAITTVVAVGAPVPVHAATAPVATVSCDPVPAGSIPTSPPLPGFTATTPRRLVDTRYGTGGITGPIGAGCVMQLDLAAAAIPTDAGAVSLSLTALSSKPGFMTVFPCSSGVPVTSNLNSRPGGFPTPNLVVAVPDADRHVCVYSLFASDLLVDVTGWWTAGGTERFTSISPVRATDSRNDPGRALQPAETPRVIDLSSIIPADAGAVVANLTVTEPFADGFLTAYPCGTPAPVASNLNFRAGESRAVAITVGLGSGALLCVNSNVAHHVIVDVSGYYSPAPQFGPTSELRPVTGRRLADSRSTTGPWTSKFGNGTIRRLTPGDGLPSGSQATAAILNVIATEAEAPGFVTVYPCDQAVPTASSVNYGPGGESTNLVVVDLSASGEVCVYALSTVHVVVDLFGVMAAPDGILAERLSFGAFTWPPYTADGADYIVECGGGEVDVTLDLLPGVSARLNGVPVRGDVAALPFGTDQLASLQLRRGTEVTQQFFRCVPDGFPRFDISRTGENAPGWYVTAVGSNRGPVPAYSMVLDTRGVPIWYKGHDVVISDVELRSDGRLIVGPVMGPRYGTDPDAGYWIMSLAGTVVDVHRTVADPGDPIDPGVAHPTDHHDYVPLANGGHALLSYPLRRNQYLRGLGAGYFANDTIADGVIQEFDAAGDLVWSWRTSQYFGYGEAPYPIRWPLYPAEPNGGEVDVFHLNSLASIDDGSGDYLVSGRHLDAVFRVDHATKQVDWILGSLPVATPNGSGAPRLTVVGDALGGPRRMHDARLQGDVLTMLDNRTDTGQPARAVAYRIDAAAGTATLLWQIDEPRGRSSPGLGRNQTLPGGRVLVDWGGGLQPMFQEFDDAGRPIMSITQLPGGAAYRISKEPITAFSATLLRATAGGIAESP